MSASKPSNVHPVISVSANVKLPWSLSFHALFFNISNQEHTAAGTNVQLQFKINNVNADVKL